MIAFVFIIFLVITVGLFLAFIRSFRSVRKTNQVDLDPTISFDSQNLYRPIRSLRNGIIELAESSSDPAVRVIASSVRQEVDDAFGRVVSALQTRDQLRKAVDGYPEAQEEITRLNKLREDSESPQEKLNYTKAYEAKLNELAEYSRVLPLIKKIEDEIELTKASLSELKAKLATSGAAESASSRSDDLRSSLGNLEGIHSSVSEAQEVLRS